MKRIAASLYYRYLAPRCIVLMYHRIAVPASDVWEIAVSPQNFEAQLQVLQHLGSVVPLQEMVNQLQTGKVNNKTIAITFDDGYEDNISVALPLLERYNLPATFFLTSMQQGPFWWDALEQILLTTPQLPQHITLPNNIASFDLGTEALLSDTITQRHKSWKPMDEAAPTRRAQLYLQLWRQIQPLIPEEQQAFLQQLQQDNGIDSPATIPVISAQQFSQLKGHRLISIGAHTAQHPALGMHPASLQRHEIETNKTGLEQAFEEQINLLAYPYGNYNADTVKVAADLQFEAAFTTNPVALNKRSHPLQLGRFQVADWPGDVFEQKLAGWLRKY